MSLFSLENILLNEDANADDIINIDNIGYLNNSIRNHSFVREGYSFILEMNNDYMSAEKAFYKNILGSYGDDHIINESFSDFFDSIKKIIKKFIEWIKKVFKEFIAKINAFFKSEKYIKKHKNLLNKFSSEDEFEFTGYKFTNVSAIDIPLASACDAFDSADGNGVMTKAKINNSISGLYNTDTDTYKGILSISDYKTKYSSDKDSYNWDADNKDTEKSDILVTHYQANIDAFNDNIEDFYDWFRGYIIGKQNEPIESRDYSDELFKVFRDGEEKPESITIDSGYVMDAYRRFDKYKDVTKQIEKNQKEIIKDYEDLEKHLDNLISYNKETQIFSVKSVSRDYTKRNVDRLGISATDTDNKIYSQAAFDKMNSYLKLQSGKVSNMCSIHTQAFSAKLEAAKNQFQQDKKVLYKAIEKVLKRSNKEGF